MAADHPGTKREGSYGRCVPCYRAYRRRIEHIDYEAENRVPLRIWGLISDDPDVKQWSRDLHLWLADRRKRGIATGGLDT